MTGEIRIIGGLFKGKKIKVCDVDDLRPTSNRLRETLFNILQFDIKGAKCLDTFAGTGALGIEALSRGAKHVTFLEKNTKAYQQLKKTLLELQTTQFSIIHQDALSYLDNCPQTFDIILIDPPFQRHLWESCVDTIYEKKLLNLHGLIYLESSLPILLDSEKWALRKQNKIGDVYYAIYEILHAKS